MRIAIVGGGVMGEAFISGLLQKGIASAEDIAVSDVVPQRLDDLRATYGIYTTLTNSLAIKDRDLVVLAIKPQDFAALGPNLRPIAAGQTVLSILPGITLARIQEALDHKSVARAMPNTPAQIGQGMTVWVASPQVEPKGWGEVRDVLGSLGREINVAEEKYVDMATALSGSGPAFVFLMIEALIDAGVHIGLSRKMATEMVMQTVAGSAHLALESGRHPAELRNMVTSPGGTTAEGLLVLDESGFRAALIKAIIAAYNKAKDLGG